MVALAGRKIYKLVTGEEDVIIQVFKFKLSQGCIFLIITPWEMILKIEHHNASFFILLPKNMFS